MAQDINIKVNVDTTSAQAQTTDYGKRLKELTDEMVKLNIETEGLSKATAEQKKRFNELAQEAGNIKDAMGDAETQVNNLSDDYARLNTAIQGIQGAVGAITAVTGAMNLMGLESEEANEAIKDMTSLIAILQGLQSVEKTFNKDSLVMKALQTTKNKLLTQSIKEQTKAQVALNVAKKGMLGVIALAVTALGVLVAKYASAKNAAADLTKELNKQAADAIAKNVSELDRLKEGWNDLGDNLDDKKKFIEDNKDALADMGLAFNDVNEAEEFFQNQTDKYVEAITARAKAEAARALIVEKQKEVIEAEMNAERIAAGETTFWESWQQANLERTFGAEKAKEIMVGAAQEEADATKATIEVLKEKEKAYLDEAKAAEASVEAMKKALEEAKKEAKKEETKPTEEDKKRAKEYAEQQKKAREERIALSEKELGEIDKFIAEQDKAHNTTLQNIDEEEVAITEMYDNALDSAIKYYGEDSLQVERITALRIKALDDVDKKRKEYLDKQAKEEEDARKKADEDALKAARDAEDAQKRIEKAKLDAQLLALEENSAEYYEKKAEIDRQAEATELLALERLLWDKQITQEEYETQYDLLVANHAKTRADLEIAEAQRAKDEIDQIQAQKWQYAETLVNNFNNVLSTAMEAELQSVEGNEKKQKEVRKKYARAQFVGQIASIGISTAKAIMETWAAYGEIPFVGTALAAAQSAVIAALGIAQTISAKNQMNTALKARKGGILVGNSHERGGIMLSNGVEAEGGEAIINRRSTEAFAPLLSEINAYNGYGAPLISAQPTSSSSSSSLSSDSAIRKIVQETIAGVTAIPVVVSEHSITEAQRQVGITRERAFI